MKYFKSDNSFGNVVLNFRKNPIGDIHAYALGYLDAAKKLKHLFLSQRGYRDYEGYPIFFLYRHSVELFLKCITYKSAILLNLINNVEISEKLFLKNHQLDKYCEVLKIIFESMKWEKKWEGDVFRFNSLQEILDVILELNSIDPNSDSFRYPTNKDRAPMFRHHFILNPIHFGNIIEELTHLLDSIYSTLDYELDLTAEVREKIKYSLGYDIGII